MSRREVRGYLTAGVIGGLIALLAERKSAPTKPIGPQSANAERPQQEPQGHHPSRTAQHTPQQGWHPEESRHHRYERWYWWFTSVLTFVAAAGAICSVILSLGSLKESKQSVIEARRQADIALENLIDTDRPILDVSVTSTRKVGSDVGVPTFEITNIGSKPAILNFSQIRIDFNNKVDFAKSSLLDECAAIIGYRVIRSEQSMTAECVPTSRVLKNTDTAKDEIFYGIIFYRSVTTDIRWKKAFGFSFRPQSNTWADDGQVGSNTETRVDLSGNPVKSLIHD